LGEIGFAGVILVYGEVAGIGVEVLLAWARRMARTDAAAWNELSEGRHVEEDGLQ